MTELMECVLEPTAAGLLYLVSCAVHGALPDSKQLSELNNDALYRQAEFHMLGAMTAMALDTAGLLSDGSASAKAWRQLKDKAIRKNILLDTERKKHLDWFEANGIWYAPLKGIILQNYYPRYGMRQMSDNDILYDPAGKAALKEHMLACGYNAVEYDVTNHDEYQKEPVYNFEFHRDLFRRGEDRRWLDYYSDVSQRLLPDAEGSLARHFSDEDFYIYIVTHARKHFDKSGTGLRSLLDIYVYNAAKPSLDREYIRRETGKLGVNDFEQLCCSLAEKLFSEAEYLHSLMLSPSELALFEDCVEAGFCGTVEKRIGKKLQAMSADGDKVTVGTKLKYLFTRLFPEKEWYFSVCPYCRDHTWFIPVYWLWRIVRGLTVRRKKLKNELDIVNKTE